MLPLLVHFDLQLRIQPRIDMRFPHFTKSPALRTPAMGRIEGEEAWIEFFERLATRGTAHLGADHVGLFLRIENTRRAFAKFDRAPHIVRRGTDDDIDAVLAETLQLRETIDVLE